MIMLSNSAQAGHISVIAYRHPVGKLKEMDLLVGTGIDLISALKLKVHYGVAMQFIAKALIGCRVTDAARHMLAGDIIHLVLVSTSVPAKCAISGFRRLKKTL